jgi:hypothetical protein
MYSTPQPNTPVALYEGALQLEQGESIWKGTGKVFLRWLPTNNVIFEMPILEPAFPFPADGAAAMLRLLDRGVTARVLVAGLKMKGVQGEPLVTGTWGFATQPISVGGAAVNRAMFHAVNFHFFLSPRPIDPPPQYCAHATVFEGRGWHIQMQAVADFGEVRKTLDAVAGYAITHLMQISRTDASTFTPLDVQELSDVLYYFLSFARGRWCAPILPIGFDEARAPLWEEWNDRSVAQWRHVYSWFPRFAPDSLSRLFPGFLERWHDPVWNETVKLAVHWYIESNDQVGAIEGAIASQFLAFEVLAWTLFVEDGDPSRVHLPAGEFDNPRRFRAAKKLAMLLADAHIPDVIPTYLSELSRDSQAQNWATGPEALAGLRNCITHPTRHNRERLDAVALDARREAWSLGLWYMELILLRLFGFHGTYVNRLTARIEGEVEGVPWV